MDIIHAYSDLTEEGVITDYKKFDAVISTSSELSYNSWQIEMDEPVWSRHQINAEDYVYIPGTEYGGIVEKVKHVSSTGSVVLFGATWRGILSRRIIVPPSGSNYVSVNADAAAVVKQLIDNTVGSPFFVVDPTPVGKTIDDDYRFNNLLTEIHMALDVLDLKLVISMIPGDSHTPAHVKFLVLPSVDWSNEIEISQDYDGALTTVSEVGAYNHIIALGRGDLAARQVVQLYVLPDGTITDNASSAGAPAGLQLRTYLLENQSAESIAALRKSAEEKLSDFVSTQSAELDISYSELGVQLGDRVSIRDFITGFEGLAKLDRIIYTVDYRGESIRYYAK